METALPDTQPYHHYLFFEIRPGFYQLPTTHQDALKEEFTNKLAGHQKTIHIDSYATLGLKNGLTFMLWCRSARPEAVTEMLPHLMRTGLGEWLVLAQTYFGIVRPSQYSGRTGKPEQVIQNYDERLPYFILYPFTKTTDWHLLAPENRRSIMGQHIKTGLSHPDIRQCLLYSYGLDDQEFLVSYETPTLEEFQDLIIEMRATLGRAYTLSDTPIYTCLHKSLAALMDWL